MSQRKAELEERKVIRVQHAQELLGNRYSKSMVQVGEKVAGIDSLIFKWTKKRLPGKYKKDYRRIAQAIIDASAKHEFDPIFLLSVIQGESSFQPAMIGGVGEIGLMQIRPTTAEWIAPKFKIRYNVAKGEKFLHDPVNNIKIGAAYLAWLRERFDSHAQLYIAAYNMGQGNVDRLQDENVWPKDYPIHVMKNYVEFYAELRQEKHLKSPIKI